MTGAGHTAIIKPEPVKQDQKENTWPTVAAFAAHRLLNCPV